MDNCSSLLPIYQFLRARSAQMAWQNDELGYSTIYPCTCLLYRLRSSDATFRFWAPRDISYGQKLLLFCLSRRDALALSILYVQDLEVKKDIFLGIPEHFGVAKHDLIISFHEDLLHVLHFGTEQRPFSCCVKLYSPYRPIPTNKKLDKQVSRSEFPSHRSPAAREWAKRLRLGWR